MQIDTIQKKKEESKGGPWRHTVTAELKEMGLTWRRHNILQKTYPVRTRSLTPHVPSLKEESYNLQWCGILVLKFREIASQRDGAVAGVSCVT